MSARREQWAARTGDAAYVNEVLDAVAALRPAITAAADAGRAADEASAPGITALADRLRADGDGARRSAEALSGQQAEAALAKAAFADELVAALDEAMLPDAETAMAQVAASVAQELERADDPFASDADLDGAWALVDELLDALAQREAEDRQRLLSAKWPAAAVAAMVTRLSGAAQYTLFHDALVAAGDDGAYVGRLGAAAVRRATGDAGSAEAVLAPDGTVSIVLAALGESKAARPYLAGLTADEALLRRVMPSLLSRPVAALHDAATDRFGPTAAAALAKAGLVSRLAGPAGAALQAPGAESVETVDAYVGQVVAAGRAASVADEAGEDPDDMVTQRGAALAGSGALDACFAAPSVDDPLGTRPRVTINALGAALLAARAEQPGDYDPVALAELEEEALNDFLLLVEDERLTLMDLVPLP